MRENGFITNHIILINNYTHTYNIRTSFQWKNATQTVIIILFATAITVVFTFGVTAQIYN